MLLRFIVLAISDDIRSCEFIHESPQNPTRAEYESILEYAKEWKYNITRSGMGAELIIEDVDKPVYAREWSKYDEKRAEIIERAQNKVHRLRHFAERTY